MVSVYISPRQPMGFSQSFYQTAKRAFDWTAGMQESDNRILVGMLNDGGLRPCRYHGISSWATFHLVTGRRLRHISKKVRWN